MDKIIELLDCNVITKILNNAFLAFAEEYGFTKENAPNHLAFIEPNSIKIWLKNGLKMYGYKINKEIIGCIGYSHIREQEYLIERLAVLPENRNNGIGKKLVEYVEKEIIKINGKITELHVTDKNIKLVNWYKKQEYKGIRLEDVNIPGIEKVPFKAYIMRKELKK